jgi:saxitoxin biosynthesis operon SxtJ-like protein
MAVIDINRNPSRRDLTWFGILLAVFFGLVGAVVLWQAQSLLTASIIWSLGAILGIMYFAVHSLRLPIYIGWISVFYPIGWTVSHLILGFIFFLVLVPIGLLLRLCRYDPMKRSFEPEASSYWVSYIPQNDTARYFRQF